MNLRKVLKRYCIHGPLLYIDVVRVYPVDNCNSKRESKRALEFGLKMSLKVVEIL